MEYEYELSIIDLCKYIAKKWKQIIICAFVFCVLGIGYAFVNTRSIYRAQSSIVVLKEEGGTPIQSTDIITRDDYVSKALKLSNSKTSLSVAKSNVKLTRYNYSNEIIINYQSFFPNEAVDFLNSLTQTFVEGINEISLFSVSLEKRAHALDTVVSGPSKVKMAIIGAIGGCFLSAFLLAVKYVLDNKVRDKSFVENVLKYPVITEIGKDKSGYDRLLANVLLGFEDAKVISISSFDDAGKDVAEKLAEMISRIKNHVLLITEGEDKLYTAITDKKKFMPGKTDFKHLETLTYDNTEENATLLLSDSFKVFLDSIKEDYDHIIINTPSTSGNVLSNIYNGIADQTILVMTKDVTSAKSAIECRKQLDFVKAKIAGVVLKNI